MTKAKRVKRKPARTPLQAWCDEYGHGARAYLADTAKLRWQTVHELYMGWRTATVPTAQKIEKATSGGVPWISLVQQPAVTQTKPKAARA